MIKHGEANPLNIFGLRRMSHCPPHFEKVHFDLQTTEKDITDWVYENLSGRFYIGQSSTKQTIIAFENSSESSYFSLMLPQINKTQFF